MTVLRYTVPPENDGCRLGLFLRMQGVTAGLIKSVKYDGDGFFADDRAIRTNEPVHTGQCIRFALPPERETSVVPQPVPFSVAYEDAFAAVLDKPAGIAVHPTLNYPDGTLANGWLYRLHQQGKDGIFRPVNRIDKNTSGLVLCAQNAFAAPLLAGDLLYGGSDKLIARHALHCGIICFAHPLTEKTVRVESALPADMTALAEAENLLQGWTLTQLPCE